MLGTVNRNGTRLLFWLMAIGVLSVMSPTLWGQVRFSGDERVSEITDVSDAGRPNPFRTDRSIQQAQFQELPPQVPDAVNEAAAPNAVKPNTRVAPPAADPKVGGEVIAPEPIRPGASAGATRPPKATVDEMIDATFDPTYVEQDAVEFYSTNNTYRRGYWYSQQEFVALLRTEGEDVPISSDQSDIVFDSPSFSTNRPVITSKTTDHTYEPGVRLTLGRFLGQDVANRDHSIEFTFLGLFEFESSAAIRSVELPGYLDTALGAFKTDTYGFGIIGNNRVPGFSGALEHATKYKTDLDVLEANYRIMGRPLRDRIALQPNGSWVRHATASSLKSFILGARYISANEDFKYYSEFLDTAANAGFLNVRTGNEMFGMHAGFDIQEAYTTWGWGFRAKFGGLYNFADRHSFLSVINESVPSSREQEISKNNLAVAVDVGFAASYQIRKNLIGRIRYDALYITGLATAPENMGLAPEWPNFEVTGDVLYHGLSVGFETLW
ncbi:MAG: hypothetical protein P8N76_03275 [Pirellulaceae bacterium]|nr:hypothetical protein [Pirellulaceae bacterium]